MDATTLSVCTFGLIKLFLNNVGGGIVKKAGEEVGKKTATKAWRKIKALFEDIKHKMNSKKEGRKLFEDIVNNPNDNFTKRNYQDYFINLLQSDDEFKHKLVDHIKDISKDDVDTVFKTNIFGDIGKYTQIGNVYGDVNL